MTSSLRYSIVLHQHLAFFLEKFIVSDGIANKAEWLGSPANIKGANKDAKI